MVRPTSRALDVSSARKERSDFWNYEPNAKVADSSPGVAPQDLAKLFAGSEPGIETNYAQVVSPDIVDLLVAKNGALDRSLVDAVGANSGRVESRQSTRTLRSNRRKSDSGSQFCWRSASGWRCGSRTFGRSLTSTGSLT